MNFYYISFSMVQQPDIGPRLAVPSVCSSEAFRKVLRHLIQGVPLATEPGISSIILTIMKILQRNLKRTYLIV